MKSLGINKFIRLLSLGTMYVQPQIYYTCDSSWYSEQKLYNLNLNLYCFTTPEKMMHSGSRQSLSLLSR